jgi:type III secretory pathway component EscV
MPRTFYTERDIEEMAKRGIAELEVNDSVYLTDLARETMDKLGIKRKTSGGSPASSSVLASPDVANLHKSAPPPTTAGSTGTLTPAEQQQVIDKVKSGVIARLGPGVDSAVVETIVRRVVGQL